MARSLTQLFRGLPATVHIKDPNVRRQIDAIHENLRGLKVDGATGQLFAAMASSVAQETADVVSAGGTTTPATPPAEDSDRKVGIGLADAAGPLSSKLVPNTTGTPLLTYGGSTGALRSLRSPLGLTMTVDGGVVDLSVAISNVGLDGVGIYIPPASGSVTLGMQKLVAGDGITLESEGAGITIKADGLTAVDSDASPDYLSSVLEDFGVGGTPLLVYDAELHTMGVRGLTPGAGIALEGEGETLVEVHLSIGDLTAATFAPTTHSFLVWNGTAHERTTLGAPAGCPFATGTNAGSADTVARGDHTHTGLTLPAGVNGDVLVHNGTNWVASGLESLVQTIIGSYLAGKPTVTPTTDDLVFIQTPTGFAWGAAGPCDVGA